MRVDASSSNRLPPGVHAAADYARLAREAIAAPTFAYLSGGSGEDVTLAANRRAYAAWSVCPRVLHDVGAGQSRVVLPGIEQPHPLLLAPVAHQALVHPQGEIDTARGAAAAEAGLVLSTLSSQRLEDVARAGGPRWAFQLYLQPRPDDTLALLRRAEAAGCRAIVLTVDAALQAPSRRALRAGFRFPDHAVAANLAGQAAFEPPPAVAGESRIFRQHMRHAPTWASLDWLLERTTLPVWVKGVLHPEDARALRERGAAGLVVSNHGGRGLDGLPASLDALPAVRAAVGDDLPLLVDGGIRSGLDVFKAIARGADAVLVGRLQVYALAVAGALGVAHMLRLLHEELEAAMAASGCASLADVRRATLLPARPPMAGGDEDADDDR